MTATFDFTVLSISNIVKLYNQVADRPVKTFKDKPTAIVRLQKVLEEKGLELIPNEIFGAIARKMKDDVSPGLARLRASEDAEAIRTATVADGDAARAKVRGNAPTARDTRVITVVATENPKRKNSLSAQRFALYRTGMTVDQYAAACRAAGHTKVRPGADVKWDSEHGFITLAAK